MEKVYFNTKEAAGFGGYKALHKQVKDKFSLKEVKDFVDSDPTYRKFYIPTKKIERARMTSTTVGHIFQTDLMDVQSLSKWNKNYKYILIVVDCFSRYTSARALKNKTGIIVGEGLTSIFSDLKDRNLLATMVLLGSDCGSEFIGKHAHAAYKSFNISHFVLRAPLKAFLSESIGRHVIDRLFKFMHASKTKTWINELDNVVSAKNKRVNRSLGLAPRDITFDNQWTAMDIMEERTMKRKGKKHQRALEIGQDVHISVNMAPFHKSRKGSFMEKIYRIDSVAKYPSTGSKYKNVYRYGLIDPSDWKKIAGTFYRNELFAIKYNTE